MESDSKELKRNAHKRIIQCLADVFVLALRMYPLFSVNPIFVCLRASNREIYLQPICNYLGKLKFDALLGLHALSAAGITGVFGGKSTSVKHSCSYLN